MFSPPEPPIRPLDPHLLAEPTRFQMAMGRLDHAGVRLEEVSQHYMRLVASLDSDAMPLKMRVAEVFHHLRSALEHCACELRDRFPDPAKTDVRTFFPIAAVGKTQQQFLKVVRDNSQAYGSFGQTS